MAERLICIQEVAGSIPAGSIIFAASSRSIAYPGARERPLPKCAGRTVTIVGSGRADTLKGTKRKDVILALGGPGDDRLLLGPELGTSGGPGADRLYGGPGPNQLRGGPGRDVEAGGNRQRPPPTSPARCAQRPARRPSVND